MKSVINIAGPEVKTEIRDVPIPKPGPKQVLIKVIAAGSNPKDWSGPVMAASYDGPFDGSTLAIAMENMKRGVNQGDDMAGIVAEVGEGVLEFKKGDRVAAFHQMGSDYGTYAEYSIAWDHTTFHLPPSISFEEGATIPLAAMTAGIAIFRTLSMPNPWNPATKPTPLVIYGASTAVGSFAVQVARNSDIHPIIAIAGKGKDYVKSLLDSSKGDAVFDYRDGAEKLIGYIRNHLESGHYPLPNYGIHAVTSDLARQIWPEIMAKHGHVTRTGDRSPWESPQLRLTTSQVGLVHTTTVEDSQPPGIDLGLVIARWFTRALQAGTFKGHPFEVRPGGLRGVEQGLQDIRDGKNSAVKYVYRVAETPDL